MIRWVWQNRKRAGATTQNFPKAKRLYLAIRTGQQIYGVVGIPMEKQTQPDAFTSSVLFSILGECALALESLRNAEEKEKAAVLAKNEQLRANLLRSISHDLRTPLTSISGNADTLLHSYNVLDEQTRKQIFTDIYDDAQWLTGLVENLLSITKIADGSVKLRLSDQVVDDIVSEALRHIDRRSAEHHITVDCGDVAAAGAGGCRTHHAGAYQLGEQRSQIYSGWLEHPDHGNPARKYGRNMRQR